MQAVDDHSRKVSREYSSLKLQCLLFKKDTSLCYVYLLVSWSKRLLSPFSLVEFQSVEGTHHDLLYL